MGKTYSTDKKTDVIIAQKGANKATNSHYSQRMEIIFHIIVILIVIAIIYIHTYKKCIDPIRKVTAQAMEMSNPQPLQQVQSLQHIPSPRQMV